MIIMPPNGNGSSPSRLDPDSFANGYFRNAVYRHWDPYEDIPDADLDADRERLIDAALSEAEFDELRTSIALFGAGEQEVTADLMPLGLLLEDIDDQLFVSSQIYEEAKHSEFFDRYWRDVVEPVSETLGYELHDPTSDRYLCEDYHELFDRTEVVMHRLLDADTPENRVLAYSHYHLVLESILAQTGYYIFHNIFGEDDRSEIAKRDLPHLPGLVGGVSRIRSDEGRHVGFGMHKVRTHLQRDDVDASVVRNTLRELMPHVAGVVGHSTGTVVEPTPAIEYARGKLTKRIEIITDMDASVPAVDDLVQVD
jgi:ribonucleoside-diphosphate reductase beta chain